MRPNIKIEIRNNLMEAMDVEENEEGEVIESDDEEATTLSLASASSDTQTTTTARNAFTTGVDILSKHEQVKLQERAKRFQLKPDEIQNFTEDHLRHLQGSLGITPDQESNVRFEAIYMLGVKQMGTEDLLDLFVKYAPHSIEWVSDDSCNIVWLDRLTCARALHFTSRPVTGMPARSDVPYFEDEGAPDADTECQSILLVNKNREVQLQHDSHPEKAAYPNAVDISQITIEIPPGYWRLGNESAKAKCLLLRFSLKTDRKPFKTEEFSKYYKLRKRITKTDESKQTQSIFGRNKDMQSSKGNAWSILAKNWDEDAQFREKIPIRTEEPKIEVKNPVLKVRLGTKRQQDSDEETEPVEQKKSKIPRMRMYADDEEEKIKRRKALQTLKQQLDKISNDDRHDDLRQVLSTRGRRPVEQDPKQNVDLGSMLKNRTRAMVFEVKTEKGDKRTERLAHDSGMRSRLSQRERSPDRVERHHRRSRRQERTDSESDHEHTYGNKPKSKVAVVIRTQKKPIVASTIRSRIGKFTNSDESSESESSDEDSSSSSSEEEVQPTTYQRKVVNRPGFTIQDEPQVSSRQSGFVKNPLKIEISNDHFKKT